MKSVPCIGCGKVEESYGRPRWTKKAPLCPECKEKIKAFDTLVKAVKNQPTDFAHVPKSDDIWNWGNQYSSSMWYYLSEEKTLAKPFLDVLACFPELDENAADEIDDNRVKSIFESGYKNTIRVFPKGFPKAFMKLVEAFGKYTYACAKSGEKDGSDLLHSLMSGRITNEEINQRMKKNKG